MSETLTRMPGAPLVVRLPPDLAMSAERFYEFCRLNPDLRIERTAEGEVEIMPPTGGATSNRNLKLSVQLGIWAPRDGTGEAFDSSGGFELPNGATRSPDAAWVRKERLADLTPDQWERFPPLCPDFVVELRSPSDRLREVQAKMQEWISNGARLGWLLDVPDRRVYVYRPDAGIEVSDQPPTIRGEPELPDFVLYLRLICGPDP